MKLVADENIDVCVIKRLRADGHKIVAIAEIMVGASDTKVLNIAFRGKSLLLTFDKDFGELIFRQGKASAGVLLIRLPQFTPDHQADVISTFLEEHGNKIIGHFAVLSAAGLRIRAK